MKTLKDEWYILIKFAVFGVCLYYHILYLCVHAILTYRVYNFIIQIHICRNTQTHTHTQSHYTHIHTYT